jgi:hypothetical protein
MRVQIVKAALLGVAVAAVAGGFFALGRLTDDTGAARAHGVEQARSDGYADGLTAGEAQGREEGRALQAVSTVPAASRQAAQDAYGLGYSAGANDAFGNFDGGWELAAPYVLTVQRPTGTSVYSITSRTLLTPGVNYFLCPDGHTVCHSPR